MSTATAFKFAEAFPFCVTDLTGVISHSSHVDNLTLAQVEAFAWNLESLTINTVGSITNSGLTADGTMSFTLSPIASDVLVQGNDDGSMWFGPTISPTLFASWPPIRQPNARVCQPTTTYNAALLSIGAFDSLTPLSVRHEADIGFWVGTDPVNAGKYRIYYKILVRGRDTPTDTIEVQWNNESTVAGMTAFSSGTITIAGIVFNWYSYYSLGSTPSGSGAMTASSSSFTY